MTPDDWADLIYLALLGGVIAGFYLVSQRNLSQNLQYALIWVLIFAGGVLLYGQWDRLQSLIYPSRAIVTDEGDILLRRGDGGHFHADVLVNGKRINFIVDTGATNIVLNKNDAARVGIDLDALSFTNLAYTANGTTRTAPVRIRGMVLGGMVQSNVRVHVNEGDLFGSLLGMDFLERFSEISIRGDEMRLTP